MYDLIIIGGGVAACSAGIFAGRRGLKTLIIAKDLGGQTASTSEIENYPGIGRIEGPRLIELFAQQALHAGCLFEYAEVREFSSGKDSHCVSTQNSSHTSEALLLAYGKSPKNLGISGEERYIGKGLHYCNSYEIEQYRGKTVAVVGGGNSALGLVWLLAPIARRIILIHRRDEFRGEAILLERLAAITHCEKKVNTVVSELIGDERLNALTLHHTDSGNDERIAIDGLFVAIGFESRSDFTASYVECDQSGRIIIDQRCQTSREGVFAAGDATHIPYQQIVISAGEGAKAAISAYHYISKKQGKRPLMVDWGYTQ